MFKKVLSELGPILAHNYQTLRLASSLTRQAVIFTPLRGQSVQDNDDTIEKLSNKFPPKTYGSAIDLSVPAVYRFALEDIEKGEQNAYGKSLVFSTKTFNLKYGDAGVSPSAKVTPEDLLKYNIEIPSHQLGILEIAQQVPFRIDASPTTSFVLPLSDLTKILPHKENINRYSMKVISKLNEGDAKRINLKIQQTIFEDKNREDFYEEVTSRVYSPSEHLKSSGTLMNFETLTRSIGSTGMHYHPGERTLLIFTTNKDAGAEINLCGTKEDPKDRPDCAVKIQFPSNSYLVLNFPAFTHHRFWGDFVCLSVHPREGANLIEALNSEKNGKKLDKGFLETATVFSEDHKTPDRTAVLNPTHYKLVKEQQKMK